MGTYPCSNCGARADTVTGCPECGRTVEQEIAELSKVITKMQFRNRDMVDARQVLMKRIQGAIATRSLLLQATEQQQQAAQAGPVARQRTPPPIGYGPARPVVPPQRSAPAAPPKPGKPIKLNGSGTAAPPDSTPHAHPPEVSTRSTQNVLLWLGAMLFAVTGTAYLLRALAGAGRVAVFTLLAAALLAGAIPVAKRSLTSTAETIASVGLLFVLLDGFAVRSAWLAHAGVPREAYAGLVFLASAGVAAWYRKLTHLRAPRFATMLLLQPVVPLLAGAQLHDAVSWAGALAAVGLQDLVMAMVLRSRPNGTSYLEDAAWVLHGLAVTGAAVCAATALVEARTIPAALAGAAALILAGTVGLDGGLIVRRWPLADVGAGLATLSLIGAAGRFTAVALPGRGLVCTAFAILVTAVGVRYLPAIARRGPEVAGALAAGTVGLIILGRGLDRIVAPVRAATPFWTADLVRYPHRIAVAAGPDPWQLALAALILTVAAALMLPPALRAEGAVVGATLTVLLLPAGLLLPWAATPAVVVTGAVTAGVFALRSRTVQAAWIRTGAAALLGGYATAVSLARPGAAAVTLTVVAVAGVLIGLSPWLGFPAEGFGGEFAAEAALGGAAFALPGAVAFATAALAPASHVPGPVLAASYLAVAGTLGTAALATAR